MINEALARDLLENNQKMPPSQRQRILYSLGGRGTYMEVPVLLHELRQEADHPVEEQMRIKALHRQRRRGIPVNADELKMRPFVRTEFTGPVTNVDFEPNLTEAQLQQRQNGINGWLHMQGRARALQKHHLRHRRTPLPASEPIDDDDFPVDKEDILGLSFNAQLSDEEGGEFAKKYKEYIDGLKDSSDAQEDEE